jgi:hypothetical protein
VELLSVNRLEARVDAGAPTHMQLTTGDPGRFEELAGRLFGAAFPSVEPVELGALTG